MANYIDYAPGPETWEDHRAFHCAPTIARTAGGRLFAGLMTGGVTESIDNVNIVMMSDDNGDTWTHPILAVYTDFEKKVYHSNIQLWIDPYNRLWVCWAKAPYDENEGYTEGSIRGKMIQFDFKHISGTAALICNDPDADTLVWEGPRDVCDGMLRSQPIVTKSGKWIFPAYDLINERDNYYLRFSDDEGKTFYNVKASSKRGSYCWDETMIYESLDGKMLRYLVRTYANAARASESYDGGKTWTETHNYMPHPSSRVYIGRLPSGLLAMVRNIDGDYRARIGMKVCLSDDEGETWKWELTLDTRTDVSYPDLCAGDGYIYIVYDRERDNSIRLNTETWTSDAAKEILLAKLTEEDIKSGKLAEGSYIQRVITKAGINYVEK